MDSQVGDLSLLRITPLEDGDDEIEVEDGIEYSDGDDDDDDDEEEEEEVKERVLLGFVEKPENPRSLLRHFFPSKAGGVPAWLDPVNLPSEKSGTCDVCGEPLRFVLQVYSPNDKKEYVFHRTLFIFMCPSMSCLLHDQHEQWKRREDNPRRSVKVFRCQLPCNNPFYSSVPPRNDGTDGPSTAGATPCSWCGTWKGGKVCSNCRRACYCSENHQALHWKSGHKAECRQICNSLETAPGLDNNRKKSLTVDKVACLNLWNEYEIMIEDERAFNAEMPEDNICGTSLAVKQDKQDEIFQSLMETFEADDDKKIWASFQERISGDPEQVLRYYQDTTAKPLWPTSIGRPTKADIPKCNYCKGPLRCEFQIMPQLLYYFGVKDDPDSLDWATIAVYTCVASCEASESYKEEFVWVQLHLPARIP